MRRASREFLGPWEPRPAPGFDPAGPAAFRGLLERAASDSHDCSLLWRSEDDALLGSVSLSQIVRGPFQCGFLGYWMGAPHAGRGYMTEGLSLCLRHVFGSLDLHRVEANIQPHNAPSIALVRRLGFTKEGYSPRYLKIDGAWRDHERWALLREDWEGSIR